MAEVDLRGKHLGLSPTVESNGCEHIRCEQIHYCEYRVGVWSSPCCMSDPGSCAYFSGEPQELWEQSGDL